MTQRTPSIPVLHETEVAFTVKRKVATMPLGCGFLAVRETYVFDSASASKLPGALNDLARANFGIVGPESFDLFSQGGKTLEEASGEAGTYIQCAETPNELRMLNADTWSMVVAGTASARLRLNLDDRTLTFDLATGLALPIESLCLIITQRIRLLPHEAREAAVRAVLDLPCIFSADCCDEVPMDEQVADVLRRLGSSVPLFWGPSAEVWNTVVERMHENVASGELVVDMGPVGPDGRPYPIAIMEALDRTMLSMHPEVAALLEWTPAPTP